MKAIHKKRLLKLAQHLETGKLGHDRFDFCRFNAAIDGRVHPGKCGYAGCAIGECPVVFPKHWEFNKSADPVLKGGISPFNSACDFFGITPFVTDALFLPSDGGWNHQAECGLPRLGPLATKEQVAANIRKFVEINNP